jgi:hypothetical protein
VLQSLADLSDYEKLRQRMKREGADNE